MRVVSRRRGSHDHVYLNRPCLQIHPPLKTGFSSRSEAGQGAKIPPSFKSGGSMRFHLSILLLVLAQPAFSDAYKCKGPNGQVLFTERPCENGSQASSAKSYAIDPETVRQSQAELQRQKDWISRREADHRIPSPVSSSHAAAPAYDLDAIHACLMKVTAMPNLSPGTEARRKVNCYPGGVGLIEECKSSVVATMRLSSSEEAAIKNSCR